MENQEVSAKASGPTKAPDYRSRYASDATFEATELDLRISFAEREPSGVTVHSQVVLPWATAKVIAYYMQLQVALAEASDDGIRIPLALQPPKPQMTEGMPELERAVVAYAAMLHDRFFGAPKPPEKFVSAGAERERALRSFPSCRFSIYALPSWEDGKLS